MTVLDRFKLDGKVAIVTGASSGLGVAFAQALAEAGADLSLGAGGGQDRSRLIDARRVLTGVGPVLQPTSRS